MAAGEKDVEQAVSLQVIFGLMTAAGATLLITVLVVLIQGYLRYLDKNLRW